MTTTQGCQGSDPDKVRCIHLDATSPADVSSAHRPDVKSVSVHDPDTMIEHFRMMNIPMIAVSDDIDQYYRNSASEKAAIKNLGFGIHLGELIQRVLPDGGTVCLLATANDLLSEKRIQGIRMMLSGDEQHPDGQSLSGERGWQECIASPLTIPLDTDLKGNEKLMSQLNKLRPDIVVSVSYWFLSELIEEADRNEANQRAFDPDIAVIVGADGVSGKEIDVITGLQNAQVNSERKIKVYIHLPLPWQKKLSNE